MPRFFLILPLVFSLTTLPLAVLAQEAIPASSGSASEPVALPPDTVTLTRIADQTANTAKLVAQMKSLALQPLEFEELKDDLVLKRKQLTQLLDQSSTLMNDKKTTIDQMRADQTQWKFIADELNSKLAATKKRGAELENGIAQLTREEEEWQQLSTQISNMPDLADGKKTVKSSITLLTTARKQLTIPLQEVLTVSKEWQELIDQTDEQQLALKLHENRLRKNLLTTLQSPIWAMQQDDFRIKDGAGQYLAIQSRLTAHYLSQFPGRAMVVLASTLCILLFLWRLRVHNNKKQGEQTGIGLRLPLIDRPFAATVGISTALAMVVYTYPPQLMHTLLALLLLIPVMRLGLSRLPTVVRPLGWLVSLFFAINSLSLLIETIPAVQRLWLVSCAAVGFGVCIHTMRQVAESEERHSLLWKALRAVLWLSLIATLLAMIGGIVGAATFAQFIITGIAYSAYAGLCMVVLAGIFSDLAVAALYIPSNSSSQLINHNRPLLVARISRITGMLCFLAWIHFTLQQFMLLDWLWESATVLLGKELAVGNLAVSLGDVLAVGFTLWISIKLSQLLRFIFIEDIAPRAKLERGVPDAIATLMHYFIILVGFMMAISAAGIDMSKLAIMAGALGVGIGIGLQDVVNNFTSGLILLFEQNIKQADIIQCSTVNGKVIHIGMRSSVVRTFDGAEVIVPNSQLVSAQVINWTHSDQQRRITIPVGVAYGTDPQHVINTLLEVARNDADIMRDPEPTAFFLRFAPSSMDFELRAWVGSGEMLNEVVSRLCVAIAHQFKENSIHIPFPQQDVHVRSLPEGFTK